MNKICISNLVYGQSYTDIFLNFHLKSLLENLDGNNFINSYYFIFTEETNIKTIESHNNYQKLKDSDPTFLEYKRVKAREYYEKKKLDKVVKPEAEPEESKIEEPIKVEAEKPDAPLPELLKEAITSPLPDEPVKKSKKSKKEKKQ